MTSQQLEEKIDTLLIDCYHAGSMAQAGKTVHSGTVLEYRKALLALIAEERLETRNVVAKLRGEYANTPLDKRGNGWDWLGRIDKELQALASKETSL